MRNEDVAQALEEVAGLLEEQGASPSRVERYRQTAGAIRHFEPQLDGILQAGGVEGLRRTTKIGVALAHSVRELLLTGRLPVLDRLRGESDPVAVLTSVPGIGETLATRLHEELGIDSLEDLEAAAHDGRLDRIKGFGERRRAQVVESLDARLGRTPDEPPPPAAPPVDEILDVDREYREKASAGVLRRIAPRRLNPAGEAWLPVLHSERGERYHTALFSNTARAHQLGKTRDWVVVYFEDEDREGQCTVVTGQWGRLRGKRHVRGREAECQELHRRLGTAPPTVKVPG